MKRFSGRIAPFGLLIAVVSYSCSFGPGERRFAVPHTEQAVQLSGERLLLNSDGEMVDSQHKRVRNINVDLSAISPTHFSMQTFSFNETPTPHITLDLFPDVQFRATKHRVEKRSSNDYGWIGRLEGIADSQVVLQVTGDKVVGTVREGRRLFLIEPRTDLEGLTTRGHQVAEIVQSGFPPELEPTSPVDMREAEKMNLVDESAMDVAPESSTGATIDLLVAYTPAAKRANPSVEILIEQAVLEANEIFLRSKIGIKLRLVHIHEVNYVDSGNIITDRDRLQKTGDGFMDEIHALRDSFKADLVSLWIEETLPPLKACGLSYIMSDVNKDFEKYAFSVVPARCAVSNLSFIHELGHNFGARHDWQKDQVDHKPFPFNHGYVHKEQNWRTIMGYEDGCGNPRSCVRIPRWSDPSEEWEGFPLGIADSEANPTNNRRTLLRTAPVVENFR